MKKLLCTSLALLMVVSGVTVAFAAGTPTATTVAAVSTSAATSSAIETNNSTSSAIDAKTTGSAIDNNTTGSAIDANATDAAIASDGAIRNIVPDMTFIGTPIKLSLQDAYKKILNDSPGKEVAELNRKDALAISQGYVEDIQDTVTYIEKSDGSREKVNLMPKKAKQIKRALRDYAKTQAEPNYQAELNKLKVDTMTNYYQLKQLEDLEKIAQETLDLKEKLLANTQLKFKLGIVAKSDVLQAESAVNNARDSLLIAQNNLRLKKMAFNTFMGYDLMQNVTLTDSLKQVDLPDKTMEASIKDALANRNEIKAANFRLQVAKLTLDVYTAYPPSASTVLKAKVAIVEGEKAVHDANDGIEMDVRGKYMSMKQKATAIQAGQKTVENAKEGLRLVQLQYDAGMATLTDVNTAQIAYNQSEVALSNNMLDYNLAVEAYNYASGVGTTTAPIQ